MDGPFKISKISKIKITLHKLIRCMRTNCYEVLLSMYDIKRGNIDIEKFTKNKNSQVGNSTTGTAIEGITVGHIGMGISATPSFLDWFLHCASILNFFRRCALHFFFLLFAQIYSVHIFWVLHRYFVEIQSI